MLGTQNEIEEEEFVDVRSLPLKPPQPLVPAAQPVRRPWHPVMWDDSISGNQQVPTQEEEEDESKVGTREYPHKQRIRNLRRLINEGKVKPTSETLIFFLCNKFAVSEERPTKLRHD